MKITNQFDPTDQQFSVSVAINNGQTFTTQQQGTFNPNITAGYGKLLVINQSNCDLTFYFAGGLVDYIPARSYRVFEVSLPSWTVNWIATNFPADFIQPNVTQRVSQVTIVSYDQSENVGPIEPVTNTNYLWSPADTIIQDPQFGQIAGTSTTPVTLTPGVYINPYTDISPLVYLQQISLSINQTASSSDHADIQININTPQSLGGNWKQVVHVNNTSNNVYIWNFSPALASNSLQNNLNVSFTLLNVTGSGISGTGCYGAALFYHV